MVTKAELRNAHGKELKRPTWLYNQTAGQQLCCFA